ncbi:MAG: UDP-3-O-(3-hydroxymyristoyl)glucosamine N-acyltransferase [Desulfobulbaceae bacterium]|jgi:UDP-3-O-[3-hydroxymyristoyl] glucosamine N-acyltransferase|nr:UDP-3-O-(3-hydroxymyristoyl)glucosamine N-acyltransferase [Desulfobulbaceae bacterium]MDY0350726.1 UDP-3-O-(3-hydroxymyristoyl)glucosamine N-acyltransferase [Desulfobulbaceae bacterium]
MADARTLSELAALVGGKVIGDGSLRICGLNGIEQAGGDEITFITGGKMADKLATTKAAASIVPPDIESPGLPCIQVDDPDFAAAVIHNFFLAGSFRARGIHPLAHVGAGASLAEEISVGPFACIGDRVRIGRRVTIHPGVVIGDDSVIGDDTVLHANVTIGERSVIGSRVIIHSGVVIGSDGFGYATGRDGRHMKKPQVGTVRIDDDVEIGANSCVDRAAFGTTRIRSGVKIDNLVMIAHNVEIGENSILVAQTGIAGSTRLGRNVVVAAKAGMAGHLEIGDRVRVAAMAGVHGNLPAGAVVGGAPAIEVKKWGRATAAFSRMPEMLKEIRRLRREVDRLTALLERSDSKKD